MSSMADRGLQEAIRAVGGVTELARRIGISQPSVSNWIRVPAERVLQVEGVSGIARTILRPDLYVEANIDDVNRARAQEYALLARLLREPPDSLLLKQIGQLHGDETILGAAHHELAEAAKRHHGRTRILRSFHRRRPRRASALCFLLSYRFPARAAARALTSRFDRHRYCARARHRRAGGPRRDLVRDHGGSCRWSVARAGRVEPHDF